MGFEEYSQMDIPKLIVFFHLIWEATTILHLMPFHNQSLMPNVGTSTFANNIGTKQRKKKLKEDFDREE